MIRWQVDELKPRGWSGVECKLLMGEEDGERERRQGFYITQSRRNNRALEVFALFNQS